MHTFHNYYKILGVSKEAGSAEIKAAYRQLAKKYHPDQNPSPDAHKQFVAINAAHSVLSDPFKRKLYDLRRQASRVIYAKPKNPNAHPADPEDAEEMRRRYWASPAGQQKIKELNRESNIQHRAYLILKMLSIPMILFLILFLVERDFPKYVGPQKVTLVKYNPRGGIYTLGAYPVQVNSDYGAYMLACDSVEVYVGRVFGLVTAINLTDSCDKSKLSGNTQFRHIPISGSLFDGPGFLIYLVLVFFCFMWWIPDPVYGNAVFIFAFVFNIFIWMFFWRLLP